MKFSKTTVAALFATSMIVGGTASAQFGSFGKKIKQEAKKKSVEEADKALDKLVNGKSGKRSKKAKRSKTAGSGSTDLGTPAASLTAMTQCAGVALSKVTLGYLGDYTFQQGFSKEKRSGFIDRQPAKANQCVITPGLQPNQVLYFEVNEKAYKAQGSSNDWTWQCVRSDDPGAGTTDYWIWNSDRYLSDSHMKLHCGNDQGVSDCATGSNSARASAYSSDMKKRGKYGVSFLARHTGQHRGPTEKLYCQFYNKRSGKSLVAFEYLSTPGR